ncbi:MAG: tyrosine-type recombinase/integrase [Clostridia bacterium]|nr:tyrosine-type recombinase/integrase [Clostridia bacterium]
MERHLDGFFRFLKETRKMKENTMLSYRRDITAFLEFAKQSGKETPEDICNIFGDYLDYLQKESKSPATLSRNIASLRCLFRYLISINVLKADPSKGRKYEQNSDSSKEYQDLLTTDEVDRLISCTKTEDIKGYRDCAILETLYATGLKVSEFLNLRVEDLHLLEGYLTVTSDGHTRYVPLYKGALQAIRNYLKKSRKYLLSVPKTDVLFLNQNGQPFSRQGLWKLLKTYAKKAGLTKELTPQLLRQSMAVHLMENGADVTVVQELLGHKNLALTRQYVKNFKPKILSDYTRYHPKSQQ